MPPCFRPFQKINDKTGNLDTLPCGVCNFCLSRKRDDWSFRLQKELKISSSAYFLTLTYDEEHLPLIVDKTTGEVTDTELVKDHLGDLLSSLRHYQKHYDLSTKQRHRAIIKRPKFRYYAVGEYGTKTDRPHYHAIMFNLLPEIMNIIPTIWTKGHCKIGSVTDASIHYVTKYVIDKHGYKAKKQKPFSFMSKRPGLGSIYWEQNKIKHVEQEQQFVVSQGYKLALPKYYAKKSRINETEEEQKIRIFKSFADQREREDKQIRKLQKLSNRPFGQLVERTRVQHEKIRIKSVDKNIL